MDDMQLHEVRLLQDMAPWANKDLWETARWLMAKIDPPKHPKNIKDYFPLITDKDIGEPIEKLEGEQLNEVRRRIIQAFSNKNKPKLENG